MAFAYKEMVITVATVLFLVVAMAPQWAEAQAPQPMPALDPICATSIPKFANLCYDTTSTERPSEECCKSLRKVSTKDVTCLCDNFLTIPHPLYANVTIEKFFNVNILCGAHGKDGGIHCKDYIVPSGGSTNKIAASLGLFGLAASLIF